jgi:hypothetical protein
MAWYAVGSVTTRTPHRGFGKTMVVSSSYETAFSAALAYPDRMIVEAADRSAALAEAQAGGQRSGSGRSSRKA